MKKLTISCALLTTALFLLPTTTRARDYSANTGRFMTMDTFEGDQQDPKSLHKYAYVADNPVNNIDPSGENYYLGGTTEGHGHFWAAVDIGNGRVQRYDYMRAGFIPAQGMLGSAKDLWYASSGPGQATNRLFNSIMDATGPRNESYMFLESGAEDLAMAQRMVASAAHPADYSLLSHNCGHASFEIAEHGWPALAPLSPRPAAFLQVVKTQWRIKNAMHASMNANANSIPDVIMTMDLGLP